MNTPELLLNQSFPLRPLHRLFKPLILLPVMIAIFMAVTLFTILTTQEVVADQDFTERFRATGRLDVIATGVGTRGDPNTNAGIGVGVLVLDIPPTATIQIARLIWTGRAQEQFANGPASFDADGVQISVDGGPPTVLTAELQFTQDPWYAQGGLEVEQMHESRDITNMGIVQTGLHTYTISDHEHGLTSGPTETDLNYGVGLWVVYEDINATPGEVVVYEGQDSFFRSWDFPRGPHTDVRCADFTPDPTMDRNLETIHLVSGVDHAIGGGTVRSNAFWHVTGAISDTKPPTLPSLNGLGGEDPTLASFPGVIGYNPGVTYPLQSNAGLEWDNFEVTGANVITVPMNHAWSCFQIESGDSQGLSAYTGPETNASGQWNLFAVKVEIAPTAVSLVDFRVAEVDGDAVTIVWETAAEIDNFGFNLYRAPVNDFSQAIPIHFEPSAFAGGNGAGQSYTFVDTVPSSGNWWYWLEDVDTAGTTQRHGPISTIRSILHSEVIFLPLILAGK